MRSFLSFGVLAFAAAAQAVTIYGLSESQQLVKFDSSTPGSYQYAYSISGLVSNEKLVGIDFRPATKQLYGLGSFGNLYTINTMNAMATKMSTVSTMLDGSRFGTDFNPVPDRLRVTTTQEQNLRINVATGAAIVDGALSYGNGMNPNIVASAYTNSFAGTTSTTLYNLDSENNSLVLQNPPNAGGLTVVGGLGVDFDDRAGFDIHFGSTNFAFAALNAEGASSSSFYSLNLMTGAATLVGDFLPSDRIVGIAAEPVPEPGTLAALALGLAALRRRRKA